MAYDRETFAPVLTGNTRRGTFEGVNYLDGDFEKISDAVYASAAIPIMTEPLSGRLCDGGMFAPSPFTVLYSQLLEKRSKITYVTHDYTKQEPQGQLLDTLRGLLSSSYDKELRLLENYAKTLNPSATAHKLSLSEASRVYRDSAVAVMILRCSHQASSFNILRMTDPSVEMMRYVIDDVTIYF